ncbi:hypothetical protein IID21_05210, partial [Patescibacteria group bacterium]|nr:hypothetical protein [Patescibacteria group bacterium]
MPVQTLIGGFAMLLTRELKSVALIVLVMFVADANAAPKGKPKILVPLNVKSTYFVYSNPKPIKKYIEERMTLEIKQLDKGKSKLKGRARKHAVLRSKRLKRQLAYFQKKNIVPESLRKTITERGIGFIDTGKNHYWVRVARIINDREFIATIDHQSISMRQIRISGTSYGLRTTRTNIKGT